MTKSEQIENWLKENNIDYYKSKEGLMSIPISDIPKEISDEYHQLVYRLQQEQTTKIKC